MSVTEIIDTPRSDSQLDVIGKLSERFTSSNLPNEDLLNLDSPQTSHSLRDKVTAALKRRLPLQNIGISLFSGGIAIGTLLAASPLISDSLSSQAQEVNHKKNVPYDYDAILKTEGLEWNRQGAWPTADITSPDPNDPSERHWVKMLLAEPSRPATALKSLEQGSQDVFKNRVSYKLGLAEKNVIVARLNLPDIASADETGIFVSGTEDSTLSPTMGRVALIAVNDGLYLQRFEGGKRVPGLSERKKVYEYTPENLTKKTVPLGFDVDKDGKVQVLLPTGEPVSVDNRPIYTKEEQSDESFKYIGVGVYYKNNTNRTVISEIVIEQLQVNNNPAPDSIKQQQKIR